MSYPDPPPLPPVFMQHSRSVTPAKREQTPNTHRRYNKLSESWVQYHPYRPREIIWLQELAYEDGHIVVKKTLNDIQVRNMRKYEIADIVENNRTLTHTSQGGKYKKRTNKRTKKYVKKRSNKRNKRSNKRR